jgi:Rab11 family-interacting protein 3/4
LVFRIHVLEEQLREMDQRSDEKLADEQKRNRDLLARMEREKQLEVENYSIR